MPLPGVNLQIKPLTDMESWLQQQDKLNAAMQQALMKQQAAAARGGGGRGGAGKGSVMVDPKTGEQVWVPGTTPQERTANYAAMKSAKANQAVAANETLKGLREKQNSMSVESMADALSKWRTDEAPAIAEAAGVDLADVIQAGVGDLSAENAKKKKAVDSTSATSVFGTNAAIAWDAFADSIAGLMDSEEEKLARQRAHEEYAQRKTRENAWLVNDQLRQAEGAGITDRLGANMIAGAVGSMAPEIGANLAAAMVTGGLGLAVGSALTGARAARVAGTIGTALTRGERASQLIGAALGGGASMIGTEEQRLAERLVADESLTEEQRIEALRRETAAARGLGFASGAMVLPFGEAVGRGAGRLLARTGRNLPFSGNENLAQAYRAANRGGTKLTEEAIAGAKAADAAAEAERGFLSRYVTRGIPYAALEAPTIGGALTVGGNVLYNQGTGKETPVTEGLGEAMLGAIAGAPLFGVFATPHGAPGLRARAKALEEMRNAPVKTQDFLDLAHGKVTDEKRISRILDGWEKLSDEQALKFFDALSDEDQDAVLAMQRKYYQPKAAASTASAPTQTAPAQTGAKPKEPRKWRGVKNPLQRADAASDALVHEPEAPAAVDEESAQRQYDETVKAADVAEKKRLDAVENANRVNDDPNATPEEKKEANAASKEAKKEAKAAKKAAAAEERKRKAAQKFRDDEKKFADERKAAATEMVRAYNLFARRKASVEDHIAALRNRYGKNIAEPLDRLLRYLAVDSNEVDTKAIKGYDGKRMKALREYAKRWVRVGNTERFKASRMSDASRAAADAIAARERMAPFESAMKRAHDELIKAQAEGILAMDERNAERAISSDASTHIERLRLLEARVERAKERVDNAQRHYDDAKAKYDSAKAQYDSATGALDRQVAGLLGVDTKYRLPRGDRRRDLVRALAADNAAELFDIDRNNLNEVEAFDAAVRLARDYMAREAEMEDRPTQPRPKEIVAEGERNSTGREPAKMSRELRRARFVESRKNAAAATAAKTPTEKTAETASSTGGTATEEPAAGTPAAKKATTRARLHEYKTDGKTPVRGVPVVIKQLFNFLGRDTRQSGAPSDIGRVGAQMKAHVERLIKDGKLDRNEYENVLAWLKAHPNATVVGLKATKKGAEQTREAGLQWLKDRAEAVPDEVVETVRTKESKTPTEETPTVTETPTAGEGAAEGEGEKKEDTAQLRQARANAEARGGAFGSPLDWMNLAEQAGIHLPDFSDLPEEADAMRTLLLVAGKANHAGHPITRDSNGVFHFETVSGKTGKRGATEHVEWRNGQWYRWFGRQDPARAQVLDYKAKGYDTPKFVKDYEKKQKQFDKERNASGKSVKGEVRRSSWDALYGGMGEPSKYDSAEALKSREGAVTKLSESQNVKAFVALVLKRLPQVRWDWKLTRTPERSLVASENTAIRVADATFPKMTDEEIIEAAQWLRSRLSQYDADPKSGLWSPFDRKVLQNLFDLAYRGRNKGTTDMAKLSAYRQKMRERREAYLKAREARRAEEAEAIRNGAVDAVDEALGIEGYFPKDWTAAEKYAALTAEKDARRRIIGMTDGELDQFALTLKAELDRRGPFFYGEQHRGDYKSYRRIYDHVLSILDNERRERAYLAQTDPDAVGFDIFRSSDRGGIYSPIAVNPANAPNVRRARVGKGDAKKGNAAGSAFVLKAAKGAANTLEDAVRLGNFNGVVAQVPWYAKNKDGGSTLRMFQITFERAPGEGNQYYVKYGGKYAVADGSNERATLDGDWVKKQIDAASESALQKSSIDWFNKSVDADATKAEREYARGMWNFYNLCGEIKKQLRVNAEMENRRAFENAVRVSRDSADFKDFVTKLDHDIRRAIRNANSTLDGTSGGAETGASPAGAAGAGGSAPASTGAAAQFADGVLKKIGGGRAGAQVAGNDGTAGDRAAAGEVPQTPAGGEGAAGQGTERGAGAQPAAAGVQTPGAGAGVAGDETGQRGPGAGPAAENNGAGGGTRRVIAADAAPKSVGYYNAELNSFTGANAPVAGPDILRAMERVLQIRATAEAMMDRPEGAAYRFIADRANEIYERLGDKLPPSTAMMARSGAGAPTTPEAETAAAPSRPATERDLYGTRDNRAPGQVKRYLERETTRIQNEFADALALSGMSRDEAMEHGNIAKRLLQRLAYNEYLNFGIDPEESLGGLRVAYFDDPSSPEGLVLDVYNVVRGKTDLSSFLRSVAHRQFIRSMDIIARNEEQSLRKFQNDLAKLGYENADFNAITDRLARGDIDNEELYIAYNDWVYRKIARDALANDMNDALAELGVPRDKTYSELSEDDQVKVDAKLEASFVTYMEEGWAPKGLRGLFRRIRQRLYDILTALLKPFVKAGATPLDVPNSLGTDRQQDLYADVVRLFDHWFGDMDPRDLRDLSTDERERLGAAALSFGEVGMKYDRTDRQAQNYIAAETRRVRREILDVIDDTIHDVNAERRMVGMPTGAVGPYKNGNAKRMANLLSKLLAIQASNYWVKYGIDPSDTIARGRFLYSPRVMFDRHNTMPRLRQLEKGRVEARDDSRWLGLTSNDIKVLDPALRDIDNSRISNVMPYVWERDTATRLPTTWIHEFGHLTHHLLMTLPFMRLTDAPLNVLEYTLQRLRFDTWAVDPIDMDPHATEIHGSYPPKVVEALQKYHAQMANMEKFVNEIVPYAVTVMHDADADARATAAGHDNYQSFQEGFANAFVDYVTNGRLPGSLEQLRPLLDGMREELDAAMALDRGIEAKYNDAVNYGTDQGDKIAPILDTLFDPNTSPDDFNVSGNETLDELLADNEPPARVAMMAAEPRKPRQKSREQLTQKVRTEREDFVTRGVLAAEQNGISFTGPDESAKGAPEVARMAYARYLTRKSVFTSKGEKELMFEDLFPIVVEQMFGPETGAVTLEKAANAAAQLRDMAKYLSIGNRLDREERAAQSPGRRGNLRVRQDMKMVSTVKALNYIADRILPSNGEDRAAMWSRIENMQATLAVRDTANPTALAANAAQDGHNRFLTMTPNGLRKLLDSSENPNETNVTFLRAAVAMLENPGPHNDDTIRRQMRLIQDPRTIAAAPGGRKLVDAIVAKLNDVVMRRHQNALNSTGVESVMNAENGWTREARWLAGEDHGGDLFDAVVDYVANRNRNRKNVTETFVRYVGDAYDALTLAAIDRAGFPVEISTEAKKEIDMMRQSGVPDLILNAEQLRNLRSLPPGLSARDYIDTVRFVDQDFTTSMGELKKSRGNRLCER